MKKIGAVMAAMFLIAALGMGALISARTDVRLGEKRYLCSSESLDLPGKTLSNLGGLTQLQKPERSDQNAGSTSEEGAHLQQAQPERDSVPEISFQGELLPRDIQSLTIASLTDDEVDTLDVLTSLKEVDAWDCTDYAQLAALMQRHPDCKFRFRVFIGDTAVNGTAREITLNNPDLRQAADRLPMLPNLEIVRFTGVLGTPEALTELADNCPNTAFFWNSLTLDPGAAEFSLAGLSATGDEAAALLAAMPELTRADLTGAELSNAEGLALVERFPQCSLLLTVQLGDVSVRTDAEEIDLSDNLFESTDELEAMLPCFPNLKKVIMSNCGMNSEEMDALNRRYEDIRFVWTVMLGEIPLRTDADFFAPCVYSKQVNTWDIADLKYCTDLVCIDLGHMNVNHCEWAAEMPHLKYLIIADTDITDISPLADRKELVFLEMFLTCIHDVSPLVSCTALEDLNLCYDYIYDPTVVGEMTWLKRLWWSGPNWEAQQALQGKLPDTEIVWDSGSSTGGSWRLGQRYFEMRDIMGMYYMVG